MSSHGGVGHQRCSGDDRCSLVHSRPADPLRPKGQGHLPELLSVRLRSFLSVCLHSFLCVCLDSLLSVCLDSLLSICLHSLLSVRLHLLLSVCPHSNVFPVSSCINKLAAGHPSCVCVLQYRWQLYSSYTITYCTILNQQN